MVKKAPAVSPPKRRRIGASEFKSHCLQLLDHVQHSGEELEITKRGEPVAIVTPVRASQTRILGLFRERMKVVGDIVHVDWTDEWEAAR